MQEELEQKSVAISIKAGKLTANLCLLSVACQVKVNFNSLVVNPTQLSCGPVFRTLGSREGNRRQTVA